MSRDAILHKVRSALGRSVGQMPPPPSPPMLLGKMLPDKTMDIESRVASFVQRFEALAGKAVRVANAPAAAQWLNIFLAGRTAVACNAPYLCECGVTSLPGVQTGLQDPNSLRAACAHANVGVTSADYALAETGSMVMISSPKEARLISLLPPVHVGIFPQARILVGLDELLTVLPTPADQTSSMVLITGPSRTADIEQILVRGVHGPGEVYAIIVEE